MLDIKRILANPDEVRNALLKRVDDISFDELIALELRRKTLQGEVDTLRSEINAGSKEIGYTMANKSLSLEEKQQRVAELKAKSVESGKIEASKTQELRDIESQVRSIMERFPNIPDDDVVAGGKENNVVLYQIGSRPEFNFQIKNHVELCEAHNLIDYKRGIKIAGEGSWIYVGNGARLEWAIISFFIEQHIEHGYTFHLVPHMLNYECGYVAGQFPKFRDEVYWIDSAGVDEKGKFLLPTAESALVNLHRNEILMESELPKRYCAYSPCFRREAGSSRIEEKGVVRGHQFNKVEMVQYTRPQDSDAAFEEMLEQAEGLMKALGLHYQVSKLAAGDCSASMARTYDIEVYIPSMDQYKEVSSVSNGRDYQARRGNIRYKDSNGKKQLVHTLNGSGLATSRVFAALIEQFQQADGTILVPEVLRKYMGGLEVIS